MFDNCLTSQCTGESKIKTKGFCKCLTSDSPQPPSPKCISQVPRLPWMSVGRTNPLRAAFFSSGASGAKNVAFTPPYNIHNWIPLHVTWPRASPKLLKFNSSRSYGRFRCASSLSTRAHYTYLQYFSQFSARICDQRSFRISHNNKSLF